ncbi:MAG: protein kinase, partial [Paramarteilia canceri]
KSKIKADIPSKKPNRWISDDNDIGLSNSQINNTHKSFISKTFDNLSDEIDVSSTKKNKDKILEPILEQNKNEEESDDSDVSKIDFKIYESMYIPEENEQIKSQSKSNLSLNHEKTEEKEKINRISPNKLKISKLGLRKIEHNNNLILKQDNHSDSPKHNKVGSILEKSRFMPEKDFESFFSNAPLKSSTERIRNSTLERVNDSVFNLQYIDPVAASTEKIENRNVLDAIKEHAKSESEDENIVNPFTNKFKNSVTEKAFAKLTNIINFNSKVELSDLKSKSALKADNDSNENFIHVKQINQGGFGRIYLYKTASDPQKLYAIKATVDPFLWELIISDSIHSKLPKMISNCTSSFFLNIEFALTLKDGVCYASDYLSGGTLVDLVNYFSKPMSGLLHELLLTVITEEIAEIIQTLHKMKIIHIDIKPDNFMLK